MGTSAWPSEPWSFTQVENATVLATAATQATTRRECLGGRGTDKSEVVLVARV